MRHIIPGLLVLMLSACHSSMPPRPSGPASQPPVQTGKPSPPAPTTPSTARPASALPSGPKVVNVEPRAETTGNPTAGIDPTIPLETTVTPKLEPIVTGTTKPYIYNGETVTPMSTITPFEQTGMASWYGKKFHGLKTASGEPYNMYKLTGAHKTLPIPSYVRVTHLGTQKSVIVKVNDRGPFAHNRIMDLSYAAAKQLDIIRTGSAKVTISLIDPEQPNAPLPAAPPATTTTPLLPAVSALTASGLYVQVGAFIKEENADHLQQRILTDLPDTQPVMNKVYNGKVFQIVLGPYPSHELAAEAAGVMRDQLQLPALIFSR